MTIPVPIATSLIAAGSAILIAVVGTLFNIYGRLGKLEQGQETLAAEIRASRERSDMQFAAMEERALARYNELLARDAAAEERALAREAAMEERALARYNELLARDAAAEERALAREAAMEERALARYNELLARDAAAEERALARHNELLAEIRLWRTHGHDADGNIFFRVPE